MYTQLRMLFKNTRNIFRRLNWYLFDYNQTRNLITNEAMDENKLDEMWKNHETFCVDSTPLDEQYTCDLSLIIPLYNSFEFLNKCLSSCINQKTQHKYEVILVNDGSTDSTLQRITEYQSAYPELFRIVDQTNQGISAARNAGLKIAQGKYIGFIDHDDYIHPNYVESLLEAGFKKDADIVKCSYATERNGKIIEKAQTKSLEFSGQSEYILRIRSYIWAGIYKRTLFSYVRFPVGYWYEDMITRILIYRQAKIIVNLGDTLYFKLQHAKCAQNLLWSNKSYKCLDQLYLAMNLIVDNQKLKLPQDRLFYLCVLSEYSNTLSCRTAGLPDKERELVFLKAGDVLRKLYRKEYTVEMDYITKIKNDALISKKYELWKSFCMI